MGSSNAVKVRIRGKVGVKKRVMESKSDSVRMIYAGKMREVSTTKREYSVSS